MHYFLNPKEILTIQFSLLTGCGGKEEIKHSYNVHGEIKVS